MIQQFSADYPIVLLCEVLDCPRRSYYYQVVPTDETPVRMALEQVMIRWPFYGYRHVTAQLRREGWQVNSKVVRRLLHDFGRQCVGQVRWHTTDSTHTLPRYPNLVCNLAVTYPDQLWCADITYRRLGTHFIFLAVILDAFTRAVRGWHLGRNLSHERAVRAFAQAVQQRTPAIHHSDQGVAVCG